MLKKYLKDPDFLMNVFETMREGIMVMDEDGTMQYFNKAAEEITGYTRDEIIGLNCHDVFPGRFCGGKCLFCEDPVPTGPGTVKREIDINTKTGERRTVDTTLRMMTDGDGRDMFVRRQGLYGLFVVHSH